MRLRDIQTLINKNVRSIALREESISGDNQNLKLINVKETVSILKNLEEAKIFTEEFRKIRSFESFYLSIQSEIILQRKTSNEILSLVRLLTNNLKVFEKAISEILPDQNEFSVSIKLPKINSLNDIPEITNKVDKIINQSLSNKFINGKATVQNFDTGSEWIEILFNSAKSISVIFSIIYSAILLKREHIKNEELLEVVRNRKITNDMIEELAKQLNNKTEITLDEQISSIIKEAEAPNDDKEYHERIKLCIKETSDLIDKGLQFFPSSKSPNELVAKLPDFSKSNIVDMIQGRKEIPEETSEE